LARAATHQLKGNQIIVSVEGVNELGKTVFAHFNSCPSPKLCSTEISTGYALLSHEAVCCSHIDVVRIFDFLQFCSQDVVGRSRFASRPKDG
jgi:hypothetical protein